MAFVPPVAGHARDRAKSEAFTRRHYTIEEESDINSAASRRSSLFAVRKTVENTLPSWFETGFPQYDERERSPFDDQGPSSYYAPEPDSARHSGPSRNKVQGGPSDEKDLLVRYQCDTLGISQFNDDGQVARSRKNGTKVAIRRVMKGPTATTNDARREITILSLITDASIPSLVEWLEVPDAIWTVKEYRPYQTLGENVAMHGPLSDSMVRTALNQLFSGITSLFLAGFAHLRICPDTVCFDEQQQLVIKDLHFCCVYGEEKVGKFYAPTQEKYGSDVFVAPEVFANNTYNARKAVMWSCGVLMYFMITGQTEKLSNLVHPAFDNLSIDNSATEQQQSQQQSQQQQQQSSSSQHRRLSVAHARSKIIMYPDRFAVPSYARAIIPKMLIQDPMRRAELIEVATRVPKDFAEKATRPLMELAWVDYKYHVGPYAGLDVGAGGTNGGGGSGGAGWGVGLQSSASSIISAASHWSNPFGSLLGKGHSRRRSEPVTSRFTRYM